MYREGGGLSPRTRRKSGGTAGLGMTRSHGNTRVSIGKDH